jgi:hypothetical protein
MPFFLIVPVWLLCVLAGAVCAFFRRSRCVSLYLICVPTGGLLVSFAFSTLALLLGTRLFGHVRANWIGVVLILAYVAAFGAGGLVGIFAGFVAARSANRHLGWV